MHLTRSYPLLWIIRHVEETVKLFSLQSHQIPGGRWPVVLSGNLYHLRLRDSPGRQRRAWFSRHDNRIWQTLARLQCIYRWGQEGNECVCVNSCETLLPIISVIMSGRDLALIQSREITLLSTLGEHLIHLSSVIRERSMTSSDLNKGDTHT